MKSQLSAMVSGSRLRHGPGQAVHACAYKAHAQQRTITQSILASAARAILLVGGKARMADDDGMSDADDKPVDVRVVAREFRCCVLSILRGVVTEASVVGPHPPFAQLEQAMRTLEELEDEKGIDATLTCKEARERMCAIWRLNAASLFTGPANDHDYNCFNRAERFVVAMVVVLQSSAEVANPDLAKRLRAQAADLLLNRYQYAKEYVEVVERNDEEIRKVVQGGGWDDWDSDFDDENKHFLSKRGEKKMVTWMIQRELEKKAASEAEYWASANRSKRAKGGKRAKKAGK